MEDTIEEVDLSAMLRCRCPTAIATQDYRKPPMTDRPRESDPTDRPSDAVTGKVVAVVHLAARVWGIQEYEKN
jgi:hypothetical protein